MDKRVNRYFASISSALAISLCLSAISVISIDSETPVGARAVRPSAAYAQAKKGAKAGAKPSGKPVEGNSVTPGRHLDTPEIKSYLARLHGKFDNNWFLVDGKYVVTVTATVATDGSTSDIQITGVPSNADAEQAANEAFAKAQPFDALPASAGGTVKLTVQFDSYSDPHGDTNRNIKSQMDPIKTESAASP